MTALGDYFIKVASEKPAGFSSARFLAGAVLYGLPAIGWFFLMKSHSLALVSTLYTSSTIILLALLGYFVFRESFGLREAVGISLAIASIIVMSHE